MIGHRRGAARRLSLVCSTILTLLAALAPAPAAGGAFVLTFSTQIGSTCAQVSGGPVSTLHVVSLYTAEMELKDRVRVTSSESGYVSACFTDQVASGDRLRASVSGTTRTVTVPKLSLTIDRVTDVLSGVAPAGADLQFSAYKYAGLTSTSEQRYAYATANAAGSYSVDISSTFNLIGGDYVYGSVSVGSDYYTVSNTAGYVHVLRASPLIDGVLGQSRSATITLMTATNAVRARAVVVGESATGSFNGRFITTTGIPVNARLGDKVSGSFASDAAFTIPDVRVSADAATDVVTGKCPPSRSYKLFARRANYSQQVTRTGTSGPTGVFTRDLTGSLDIVAGDVLEVWCKLPTGDQVGRRGRV